MLRDETIFVVGAGASHELGLPVGIQLAQTISQKLDIRFDRWERTATGDQDLFESIKRHANGDATQFQQSGWLIRDGIILANSIDDFLDAHRHDERVIQMGKVAIAKSIIEAERSSKLHYTTRNVRDTINFVGCADTWLVKLMRVLVRGVAHKDRSKIFDKCAFIVFNYDRCIEHFFVHALSRFYNIDREEGGDITSKAQIFHPYGTPGPIAAGPQSIHFGTSHADWFQLGRAIKTYTESVDAAEIKEAMRTAKQIVFLGFAYHDQNMGLLADPESLGIKTIYGTAYERSASDVTAIAEQITEWIDPVHRSATAKNIHIAPMLTASQIFDYFSKSL